MARTIAKDHDQKKENILSTAAKVFAEVGFDRASMNEVARSCNLSKAALYHYFPSKNSLLFAILDGHLTALRDHVVTLPRDGRDDAAYLSFITEEILVFYQGNDDIHELQIHAMGQLEKHDRDILIGYMRELVGYVSDCIKAIAAPNVNDPNRLRMATMSLFGMLNWYYTWNRGRGLEGRREYARFVAQLFLHGVSADDKA